MNAAFSGLFYGLLAAVVLIYLLIVVNFQSWTDPFVIITALPRPGRHCLDAVHHRRPCQCRPDERHHVHGRGHRNSILVISLPASGWLHGDAVLAAVSWFAAPPGLHDSAGHDHRHVPLALGLGRREQNAPSARRDRRPDIRDRSHRYSYRWCSALLRPPCGAPGRKVPPAQSGEAYA
jgi:hypothetical protein